jgi:WbqC-like protein family
MRLSILQPSYLPWLGFFDQMHRADTFVFLDDVQFTRRDWRNRNKIRTSNGWAWLTVPVLQKNRFQQLLKETQIDNSVPWRRKHCEAIRSHYAKAPFFDLYFPALESVYNKHWDFLLDLCYETLRILQEALGIHVSIIKASEIGIESTKEAKILALCQALGASHYLTGDAGADYLCPEDFDERGIVLEIQNYRHPSYHQRYSGFFPYLSIIDLLFNEGEHSLAILSGTNQRADEPHAGENGNQQKPRC